MNKEPSHSLETTAFPLQRQMGFTLVLKGGGVRGLAFAGALEELEPYFEFSHFVGTSAGAITALFLSANCTSSRLQEILMEQQFHRLLDKRRLPILHLWRYGYIHSGKKFTHWINSTLNSLVGGNPDDALTLKQLYDKTGKHLTLIVSQTDEALVELTSDGADSGLHASLCTRCSMSIPFFFKPLERKFKACYDGGLVANYPLKEAIRRGNAERIIGICLDEPRPHFLREQHAGLRATIADVWDILLTKDEYSNVVENRGRTVLIKTEPISTLAFNLTKTEKEFLVNRGRLGAIEFLINRFRELDEILDPIARTTITDRLVGLKRRKDEVSNLLKQLEARVKPIARRRTLIAAVKYAFAIALLGSSLLVGVAATGFHARGWLDELGKEKWLTYSDWVTKIRLNEITGDPVIEEEFREQLNSKALGDVSKPRLGRANIDTLIIYLSRNDVESFAVKFQLVSGLIDCDMISMYSPARSTGKSKTTSWLYYREDSKLIPAVKRTSDWYSISPNGIVNGQRSFEALTIVAYPVDLKTDPEPKLGDYYFIDTRKWASFDAKVWFALATPETYDLPSGGHGFTIWEAKLRQTDGTSARQGSLLAFLESEQRPRVSSLPAMDRSKLKLLQSWAKQLDEYYDNNAVQVGSESKQVLKLIREHMRVKGIGKKLGDLLASPKYNVYAMLDSNVENLLVATFHWKNSNAIGTLVANDPTKLPIDPITGVPIEPNRRN